MHRKSVVIMLAFLFVLVGCAKEVAQVPLENVEVEQEAEEENKKQDGIFVFVCGAGFVLFHNRTGCPPESMESPTA